MQCTELHEHLMDLLAGETVAPEVKAHLSGCQACASELDSMNKTMALLDEWKAPEDTSPYFMTRLRARIRDEASNQPAPGWLSWFRKPALAVGLAVLLVAGISLYPGRDESVVKTGGGAKAVAISATADLQYLDKNDDVLQNLELLDDLNDNGSSRANP